jgi:hypothetical protein
MEYEQPRGNNWRKSQLSPLWHFHGVLSVFFDWRQSENLSKFDVKKIILSNLIWSVSWFFFLVIVRIIVFILLRKPCLLVQALFSTLSPKQTVSYFLSFLDHVQSTLNFETGIKETRHTENYVHDTVHSKGHNPALETRCFNLAMVISLESYSLNE